MKTMQWVDMFKSYDTQKNEILQKNFNLFSKMIKKQSLIRNAYMRIERGTVDAVHLYATIEDEVE